MQERQHHERYGSSWWATHLTAPWLSRAAALRVKLLAHCGCCGEAAALASAAAVALARRAASRSQAGMKPGVRPLLGL